MGGGAAFLFPARAFLLLATFALTGARQLSVRGLRKRWLVGAAGALTAAGLGVVALEMGQIHPNQRRYFNFLADRKPPEQLRARYEDEYRALHRAATVARLSKNLSGRI